MSVVAGSADAIAGLGSATRCVRVRTTRPTGSHRLRRGWRHSGTEPRISGGVTRRPTTRSAPHLPRMEGAMRMQPRGSHPRPQGPAKPRALTGVSRPHDRTTSPLPPNRSTLPQRPHRQCTAIASRWWCGDGPPPPCTRMLPRRSRLGTLGSSRRRPRGEAGRVAPPPAIRSAGRWRWKRPPAARTENTIAEAGKPRSLHPPPRATARATATRDAHEVGWRRRHHSPRTRQSTEHRNRRRQGRTDRQSHRAPNRNRGKKRQTDACCRIHGGDRSTLRRRRRVAGPWRWP